MNLLQEIFHEQSATARLLIDSEKDRVKLIAVKHAVRYGSNLVKWFVALALASIAFVMLAIALANYLSVVLESVTLGYLATGGVIMVFALIWVLIAKRVLRSLMLKLSLKEIYSNDTSN